MRCIGFPAMTRKQALRMAATAKRRSARQFMVPNPSLKQMQHANLRPCMLSYSNPTGQHDWVRDLFVKERVVDWQDKDGKWWRSYTSPGVPS